MLIHADFNLWQKSNVTPQFMFIILISEEKKELTNPYQFTHNILTKKWYLFMHIVNKSQIHSCQLYPSAHHWQMCLFILTNISIHAHHWQMHAFIHIILTNVSIRSHHSHKKSNGLHNSQTTRNWLVSISCFKYFLHGWVFHAPWRPWSAVQSYSLIEGSSNKDLLWLHCTQSSVK